MQKLSVTRTQELSAELLLALPPERRQLGFGGEIEPLDAVVLCDVERLQIVATVGLVVRGAQIVRAFDPRGLRAPL